MSSGVPASTRGDAADPPKTKGERTRSRILDAAEARFAARGFEAASLREIAAEAGIREPGLYNYFAGKQALYAAVLDRALGPMAEALERQQVEAGDGAAFVELPSLMTDLLCEHPAVAALFQQALRGDPESIGTQLARDWLDRLFRQGLEAARAGSSAAVDHAELAIQVIAMFNLCTGYFLSQRAFEQMAGGSLTDPENLERQKRLLGRLVKAAAG